MNILFIIGNGFDLCLGMNTRYSDFYEYYQSITTKSNNITKLKKEISKDINNWADLEFALGKYTEKIMSIEEFDEVFEDIGGKLADYLQLEEDRFDVSKINGKKISDDLAFPEYSLLKADQNKLISFKKIWHIRQWNVNVITLNYTQTLEKIVGPKKGNVQLAIHDSLPIVLERIEHIHGYVNERMVMGVNDISQVSNTTFHKNQDILEALVKNDCNQAHKHTVDDWCKQQILSANLICIFGSSIGATDNMWWDLVGEQLKKKDCQLIIFDKCETIDPRVGHKKARKEREMRKKFLEKTKMTEEEKEKFSSKIYIGLNTDMFKPY